MNKTGNSAKLPKVTRLSELQTLEVAEKVATTHAQLIKELGRVIVGQQEVMELMVTALFCQGHCILEGVGVTLIAQPQPHFCCACFGACLP